MPRSHRLRQRATPGVLLLASLIAILAVSLVLGVNAWSTTRSHQESVEHALKDYASMAAWEFSSVLRDDLHEFWWDTFEDVTWDWSGRGSLPRLSELADDVQRVTRWLDCECESIRNPLAFFRIDLRDSTFTSYASSVSSDIIARIADTLISHRQQYGGERAGLLTVPTGSILDSPTIITYSTAYGRSRRREALALFGFLTEFGAYNELLTHWFSEHPLLPPSVTGDRPNEALLHLSTSALGGSLLFESDLDNSGAYTASDTMEVKYGGMIVSATIKPEVADELIIGGIPRSRLPLILALILITAVLGAAALHQLRREHQLSRLRDDFVSGVSHELRTPLAQVRMFAELWESGKLRTDAERERSVGIINREARRLTHLVENILQFSRSGRAAVDISIEPLEVRNAVDEVVEGFGPLARARNVTLNASVEPGLTVNADRDSLKQVLLNLLDNAVKYGPDGQKVTVHASQVADRLRLSVSDEGPGIPKSDRGLVWEPYRRLHRDVTGGITGTGIGLAVVAELAAQHGGKTWVEDAPGGGACLVVDLPGSSLSGNGEQTHATGSA